MMVMRMFESNLSGLPSISVISLSESRVLLARQTMESPGQPPCFPVIWLYAENTRSWHFSTPWLAPTGSTLSLGVKRSITESRKVSETQWITSPADWLQFRRARKLVCRQSAYKRPRNQFGKHQVSRSLSKLPTEAARAYTCYRCTRYGVQNPSQVREDGGCG